jgi:hypothetical protein
LKSFRREEEKDTGRERDEERERKREEKRNYRVCQELWPS